MADRFDPRLPGLLARKGEARPAMQPDNDNAPAPAIALPLAVEAAIALAAGRGASVTLRLDPVRHMRLRLACAVGANSAQAVITEALDAHLTTIPGIDRLMAVAMPEGGDQAATGRGTER